MKRGKLLQVFRDLSISQKLFVYLVLFIILPLVVAAVIINSKATNVITNKTYENAFQTLQQTKFSMENVIQETEYLSLFMLSNDNMQQLIKYYLNKSSLDYARMKSTLLRDWGGNTLQSIIDAKPFIDSICVSNNGEIIFQFGNLVQEESVQFNATASKLKGKVLWTSLYELNNIFGSKKVISLIRAVNNIDNSKEIATERISIDENVLSSYYSGANSWHGSQIYLLDREGNVLSSTDKAILGRNLGHASFAQQALTESKGSFPSTIEGKKFVVFHYGFEETGWEMIQTIPEKELNSQLYVINIFIFLCIAICLLFGIVFSIVQNKSIVKPLKLLAKEMGKVKTGTFNVRLKVRSQDEIGRVSLIFINMVRQIEELIDRVYKSQIKEKEAELKAMQAQINPHFLYNTLDSIRWLAVKNKDFDVSEQIEALSDLFRHTLNKGKEMTTIREEIEHLNNYMTIQKNRFGDKIEFIVNVEATTLSMLTLKLVLQPLVENAIIHGMEQKIDKGAVLLTIYTDKDTLICIVEDNGVGMDVTKVKKMLETQSEAHNVFALKNIHERIQLRFGKAYGLEMESVLNEGSRVKVILPILTGGEPS